MQAILYKVVFKELDAKLKIEVLAEYLTTKCTDDVVSCIYAGLTKDFETQIKECAANVVIGCVKARAILEDGTDFKERDEFE